MKKLMWIVLALIVVIVVGVTIFLMKLDGIIQHTVETQGTKQLNVQTKLGGANLSILGGNLSLKDFSLGSPQGYTAPEMMSLGKATVTVSYSELKGTPVKVANIELDKPKLVIEQKGKDFNFKTLIDNMPKGDPEKDPKQQTDEKPTKLIIDQLTITGATVVIRPDPALIDQLKLDEKYKKDYSLTLPTIDMKGIGTGEGNQNGAAIKDVVTQVVTTIVAKASDSPDLDPKIAALMKGDLSAVADALKGEAQQRIQQEVGKLSEKAGVDINKVGQDIKSGNTEDLQKKGEDLLGSFGKKKSSTTKPAK
jgi:uncharacterized protein involved in outer membrane biogenesis